jgi:hypothetical protein
MKMTYKYLLSSSAVSRKLYNVKTQAFRNGPSSSVTIVKRPSTYQNKGTVIRRKAIENDMVSVTYTVGKYITLFTFFYTSLNYMFYKSAREEMENNEDDDKKN